MDDPVPAAQAGKNLLFLVPTILGDDECNMFADRLLGGIAEHVLSALIPALNDAVEVLADDGVVGRSDNCGQVGRCLLGLFALGDVQQHVNAANNSPLAIFDGSRIWSKPSTGSVRPFCNGLGSLDNAAFLQGDGHRTFIMWHWPAIWVVKLPTDTPLIRSEFRRSAGKVDCCGIEVSQSPLRIRGIDGRW